MHGKSSQHPKWYQSNNLWVSKLQYQLKIIIGGYLKVMSLEVSQMKTSLEDELVLGSIRF